MEDSANVVSEPNESNSTSDDTGEEENVDQDRNKESGARLEEESTLGSPRGIDVTGSPGTKNIAEVDKAKEVEDCSKKKNWNLLLYAAVVVAVAALVITASNGIESLLGIESEPPQQFGTNPNFDYVKIYEMGLQRLQESFKNQTPRFWRTLRNRGLAHLKKASPAQPLVLMIVAPPSAHSSVDCFAKMLAEILDPEHKKNLNVINGKDYTSSQGDKAKEELDNILKETLQCGHRAAVIRNLQLLPRPSPMLFHSYCDNDNAPYKHVAILFTVLLPREPDPTLPPVQTEGLVEKYLSQEVWTDDMDAVAALLSRIADTVVVLSGEDEQNLKSVCDSTI